MDASGINGDWKNIPRSDGSPEKTKLDRVHWLKILSCCRVGFYVLPY